MLLIVLRKNSEVENQNFGLGNFQESIRYFLKNLSDMVMKATNGWTTVQYNLVFRVYLTTEIIWLANDQVPQL